MDTVSLPGCQDAKRLLTKANALVLSGGNFVALASFLKRYSLPFAERDGCRQDVSRKVQAISQAHPKNSSFSGKGSQLQLVLFPTMI